MNRILVIGQPGSGKSYFSRILSNKTNIKVIHLDNFYWSKDKTCCSKEEFKKKIDILINEKSWIMDGNYLFNLEDRIKASDTIMFLDFPLDLSIKGIRERIGSKRDDLPWIESYEDGEELVSWVKETYNSSNQIIRNLLDKYSFKNILIFHSRDESNAFLNSL